MKELSKSKRKALIRKGKKMSKIKRQKKYIPIKKEEVTVSKIEALFEKVLLKEGINVKPQFQIGYKFYDFIIEGTKILIEFDGDYWHCNPECFPDGPESKTQAKNVTNDLYKNKLASANGYTLIRVWEKDFKEHPRSVLKRIRGILKESK